MLASLGALTEHLFDYAGLYPPAQLSLTESLENHLRYLGGPEGSLVAKFVCGVSKLAELGALLDSRGLTPAFDLTVVAFPPKDVAEWESTLESAAKIMTSFQNTYGGVAGIEAFEIRLAGLEQIEQRLRDLRGFTEAEVFVELPWVESQGELLYALSETETYYAKARLGGASAEDHPSAELVSKFLKHCVNLELPYKLTAGLHHEYPQLDPATGGRMHGFLNVGIAAGLALREDLAAKEIQEILEAAPGEFTSKGDVLVFQDLEFDIDAAIEARELFLGIGSCSIDEPRQELIALGYLAEKSA